MADQDPSNTDEPMEGVAETESDTVQPDADEPSDSTRNTENAEGSSPENAEGSSPENAGNASAENAVEMKDVGGEGDAKKDEPATPVFEDDGGAASDAEFETEDDRFNLTDYTEEAEKWPWHIELYPVDTEDLLLDNFNKICLTASYSQVIFRTNAAGERIGEVHLYADDAHKARGIMRDLLWRKLKKLKPYVYIYRRKEEGKNEHETAFLRLNITEAGRMRRQDVRKETQAEARLRLAKVTNVPLDSSKEMLKVVFAREVRMKRHTNKSDEKAKDSEMQAESTACAKETEGSESETKVEKTEGEKQADKPEVKTDEQKDKEDKIDDKEGDLPEEADEELDGEFNGTLTLDFGSKTSLRGFLLGYPKVVIGGNLLEIKPVSEEMDVETLKKGSRQRRREALLRRDEAKSPRRDFSQYPRRDFRGGDRDQRDFRGGGRGRGDFRGGDRGRGDFRGGDRGRGRGGGGGRGAGRGGHDWGHGGGWGRGGGMMKTGRQRMEEKFERRGGRGGGQDHRPNIQHPHSRYDMGRGRDRDDDHWGRPGSSRDRSHGWRQQGRRY